MVRKEMEAGTPTENQASDFSRGVVNRFPHYFNSPVEFRIKRVCANDFEGLGGADTGKIDVHEDQAVWRVPVECPQIRLRQ
jgi:hypothetical protein